MHDLVQEMFDGDAHMQAAFKDYTMVTLCQGNNNNGDNIESSIMQFAPDISTIITDMGFSGRNNAMVKGHL